MAGDKDHHAPSSNWRRLFSKPHQTSDDKTPGLPPPASRRMYTPRYAARDMAMSIPVNERSRAHFMAREQRLRGVCSEIGFSTDSLASVDSARRSLHRLACASNLQSEGSRQTRTTAERRGSFSDAASSSERSISALSTRLTIAQGSTSNSTSGRPQPRTFSEVYWRGHLQRPALRSETPTSNTESDGKSSNSDA